MRAPRTGGPHYFDPMSNKTIIVASPFAQMHVKLTRH
ncbi:hypothetical protein GW866_05955 [bacterium]|nr:hypothetical protein [bacterium]